MKAIFTIVLTFVILNWSFAQVHEICSFMTSTDTLKVQSDSIVVLPNTNRRLRIPERWHGLVDFEGPGTMSLKRTYIDSTELFLMANEAWLVEFHEEYVARQISSSIEYCEFDFNDYTFTVYKKENEPITMFYQIARVDREEDGWTWFFRIDGVSNLTETMMSDLKSIVTQVVEISDPNNY
jgi:hypothetical protein